LSLQSKLEGSKDDLLKKCERVSELKQEFANNSQKQRNLTEVMLLNEIICRGYSTISCEEFCKCR